MGYVIAAVGLLFLIGGVTGKTMNRHAALPLPKGLDRAIFIWCGVVAITIGVVKVIAEHKN
jgi:hypothetical protein